MSPPPTVQRAIDSIVALLGGEASDLAGATLDLDGVPSFDRGVYEVARTIPPGATLSYGEIATRLRRPHPRSRRRPGARAQPVRHRGAVPPSGCGGR